MAVWLQPSDLQRQLEVRFRGEAGVDVGGLTKEWCLLLSRSLLAPEFKLFRPTAARNGYYEVHPFAAATPRGLKCMRMIGRCVGGGWRRAPWEGGLC